jgi:hypothetical protein
MTRSFHALERSLRDGPPDESGYVGVPIELGSEPALARATGVRLVRRDGPTERGRGPRTLVPSLMTVVVLGLAVVIAIGGLAILGRMSRSGIGTDVGSPALLASPRSSAAPIAVPPLTETFVSTRNGISIRYPAGWTVRPATTSWPPDIFLPMGNSALDDLRRPGEARLTIASQRLGVGQTEDEWLAAYVPPYQGPKPCATDPRTSPRLRIDGVTAYLNIAGCPLPADTKFSVPDVQSAALVVAGGRVYLISLDGNVDQAYFEAVIATVRLDPASALDPSLGP